MAEALKIMNVLVVDKSQVILDRFRAILSEFPNIQNIWESSNTVEALTYIQKDLPDVIIIDGSEEIQSEFSIFHSIPLEERHKVATVVTLENLEAHYYQLFDNLGANYIFDKTHQFLDMYHLFDRLFTSQVLSVPVES